MKTSFFREVAFRDWIAALDVQSLKVYNLKHLALKEEQRN